VDHFSEEEEAVIERIPEPIPDLPDDPERRRAKDAFLDVFLDVGHWEREGNGANRSSAVLLGQIIAITVDAGCLERLTARLRFFLENEAVRRDFNDSWDSPEPPAFREVQRGRKNSPRSV
jgi:hypothetical protein